MIHSSKSPSTSQNVPRFCFFMTGNVQLMCNPKQMLQGDRMAKITREDALEYHHLKGKPGKIQVVPTKPMDTQRDLGLAYTPGVAEPVLEIEKNAELAYEYT